MATVNYSWTLPTVGGSTNTWGTLVNTILTDIDAKMFAKTGGAITAPAAGDVMVLSNGGSTPLPMNFYSGSNLAGISTAANLSGTQKLVFNKGSLVTSLEAGIGGAVALSVNGVNIATTSSTGLAVTGQVTTTDNVGVGVTPSAWGTGVSQRAIQLPATAIYSYSDSRGEFLTNSYSNGTNYIYRVNYAALKYVQDVSSGAHSWYTAPSGTAGNTITFNQAMTLDASGNLLVGAVGGSSHVMKKASAEGNPVLEVGSSTTGYRSALFYTAAAEGWTGSATALYVGKNSSNGRSINAGGTVNQSGADYAEYERNNGTKFAKGQVVGFKEDGTLTDVYADAIRFGVKSTNPGLVGGDSWGAEKQVGKRPDEPQFAAPEYQGQQDPGVAPIEPAQQTLPEDASDDDKAKAAEDLASAHAAWGTASAEYEKLAYEYRAARQDHEARVAVAKNLFDTATYPEYQRALTAFEARLETERQTVDRIAYCGKVPVAVYGATPGGYIVADEGSDGKIIGKFVADPDFAQYKKAVGRVNRIMDSEASAHLSDAINSTDLMQFVGMAEVAVIIH